MDANFWVDIVVEGSCMRTSSSHTISRHLAQSVEEIGEISRQSSISNDFRSFGVYSFYAQSKISIWRRHGPCRTRVHYVVSSWALTT